MDRRTEIELFVQIAELGSMSCAAEALKLSNAAASRHLAALETRLSARLVQRNTRRPALTEVGETFYRRCKPLLAEMLEAEAEVNEAVLQPTGLLRINGSLSFCMIHMAPLLPDFNARYPDLRVEIVTANRYFDLIENGIDVAIRTREYEVDSNITVRRLAETLVDLARHKLLLYTYANHPDQLRFTRDGQNTVLAVKGALEANDGQVLRAAALAHFGIFAKAVMHVPIESAREARDEARCFDADCAVAIGGGSTTGLGKAIALESGLPIIAIPTTCAGSEMTSIYGITEAGIKKTGRDARVLPRAVIYDPELSRSLSLQLSVTSDLNVIAHAAEGLYAHDGNPITALMAEEGIRAMATALGALHDDPHNLAARGDALYGAWMCSSVLGAVSMGLHHKLCHTLAGTFDLPHAEVPAVMLPHALAYNATHAPDAMRRIARALGTQHAAAGLQRLARALGAPTSL